MSQEIVLQWISGVAVPCLPVPLFFFFLTFKLNLALPQDKLYTFLKVGLL